MTRETDKKPPESGAVFTFGKSQIAEGVPSKFWLKNDKPVHISCGHSHSAFVTEHGRLFVFGSNSSGQLGLESKGPITKPVCVKALKHERVQFAACGTNHTLVSTAQGEIFAAGGNSEGQLGLGDCEDRTSFQQLHPFCDGAPIKQLSAGCNTSAALTEDGRLFMWGANSVGQLGLGSEKHVLLPKVLKVDRPITGVSCGLKHSALITDVGDVFTFGESADGRLGLSADQLANHRQPQQVGSLEGVLQVSCGGTHTLALTENELYAFGHGEFGQLGLGTFVFQADSPAPVGHFRKGRVTHVTCGENHTALITDGGLLYTFGDGRHGKLGLGDENFTNQFTPTVCQRFFDYTVMKVACGASHMLVFARLRHQEREEVCLEDEDVTYSYLDRCYTSMLLGQPFENLPDPTSTPVSLPPILPVSLPASHRWSLSARCRKRQRDSSEQFGTSFQNLSPFTARYLSMPISQNTLSPTPPPRTFIQDPHRHLDASTDSTPQNGNRYIHRPKRTTSDKPIIKITEHSQECSPSNKRYNKRARLPSEGTDKQDKCTSNKQNPGSASVKSSTEKIHRKTRPPTEVQKIKPTHFIGQEIKNSTTSVTPKKIKSPVEGQEVQSDFIPVKDKRSSHLVNSQTGTYSIDKTLVAKPKASTVKHKEEKFTPENILEKRLTLTKVQNSPKENGKITHSPLSTVSSSTTQGEDLREREVKGRTKGKLLESQTRDLEKESIREVQIKKVSTSGKSEGATYITHTSKINTSPSGKTSVPSKRQSTFRVLSAPDRDQSGNNRLPSIKSSTPAESQSTSVNQSTPTITTSDGFKDNYHLPSNTKKAASKAPIRHSVKESKQILETENREIDMNQQTEKKSRNLDTAGAVLSALALASSVPLINEALGQAISNEPQSSPSQTSDTSKGDEVSSSSSSIQEMNTDVEEKKSGKSSVEGEKEDEKYKVEENQDVSDFCREEEEESNEEDTDDEVDDNEEKHAIDLKSEREQLQQSESEGRSGSEEELSRVEGKESKDGESGEEEKEDEENEEEQSEIGDEEASGKSEEDNLEISDSDKEEEGESDGAESGNNENEVEQQNKGVNEVEHEEKGDEDSDSEGLLAEEQKEESKEESQSEASGEEEEKEEQKENEEEEGSENDVIEEGEVIEGESGGEDEVEEEENRNEEESEVANGQENQNDTEDGEEEEDSEEEKEEEVEEKEEEEEKGEEEAENDESENKGEDDEIGDKENEDEGAERGEENEELKEEEEEGNEDEGEGEGDEEPEGEEQEKEEDAGEVEEENELKEDEGDDEADREDDEDGEEKGDEEEEEIEGTKKEDEESRGENEGEEGEEEGAEGEEDGGHEGEGEGDEAEGEGDETEGEEQEKEGEAEEVEEESDELKEDSEEMEDGDVDEAEGEEEEEGAGRRKAEDQNAKNIRGGENNSDEGEPQPKKEESEEEEATEEKVQEEEKQNKREKENNEQMNKKEAEDTEDEEESEYEETTDKTKNVREEREEENEDDEELEEEEEDEQHMEEEAEKNEKEQKEADENVEEDEEEEEEEEDEEEEEQEEEEDDEEEEEEDEDEEEEEEEEEEEKEVIQKKGLRAKSKAAPPAKPAVRQRSRRERQNPPVKKRTARHSQDTQFWNNVLPQYLDLK